MTRYRDRTIATLREALETRRTVPELRSLALRFAARPPGRKAELVAFLIGQVRGDGLHGVWERLDDLERNALAEVVHAPDPIFRATRFRAKYGRLPALESLDRYGREPGSLLALFFSAGVMPADLRERLREWVPPPAEASLATLEDLPETHDESPDGATSGPLVVREVERASQQEIRRVLRLVDAGKVSVGTSTSRPGAAAQGAVAAVLERGDFYHDGGSEAGPIRAFAWPLLLQAAGLAELRGTRLRLTRRGHDALGEDPAPSLRRAFERWTASGLIDELSRIDCIKGQTGRGKRGLTAPAERRGAIADALAECPVGRWVATKELFRYMRAAGHDFDVTRDAWRLYIAEPQYGSLGYDGSGGWNILQERYALCFLFEYAATLGLIDVAYVAPEGARPDYQHMWGTDDLEFLSRYDGLRYLRLTALGAFCLGVDEDYVPPPVVAAPALRILPTLDVVAAGEGIHAGDRLDLDRYARKVSDVVWRLDRGRLLSLVEDGGSIEEVRRFLVTRSAEPLPRAAARLLEEVAERAGRIRDRGPARLIECADPALATLIANDPRLGSQCLPAGDSHLAIPARSEGRFRRLLKDLGYVVSAEGSGHPSPPSRARPARAPAAEGTRETEDVHG